jgi:hypothetical protein
MKRALLVPIVSVLCWSMGAAAPASAAVLMHHPRVDAGPSSGNLGWSSRNWSGYAITGGPFTSVTGTWVVPAVSPTKKASYSSSWVGIDGFNDSSLIQTGTEQDYFSHSAHYAAWWEILPASETVIPSITVHPGDVFTATISRVTSSSWSITITDKTSNQSFSTTQSYSGPLTSAEWIQEAPTVGGRIAPLAHYGSTTFDPGTANGHNPGLVSADGGTMVQGHSTVSTPSNPDSDSDGFNVSYGASQPSPPGS